MLFSVCKFTSFPVPPKKNPLFFIIFFYFLVIMGYFCPRKGANDSFLSENGCNC